MFVPCISCFLRIYDAACTLVKNKPLLRRVQFHEVQDHTLGKSLALYAKAVGRFYCARASHCLDVVARYHRDVVGEQFYA